MIEAETAASLEARLLFYDTDVADADVTGAVGRTGVVFSGVASADMDGEIGGLGHVAGGHLAVDAGFLVDLHHVDGDGTYLTVTLETDAAGGASMEFIDLRAAEVDGTQDRTGSMTVSMTVPVNVDTTAAVARVGGELAGGRLPVDGLGELYDGAEVDLTMTKGHRTMVEAEVEYAIGEARAEVSTSDHMTTVALHKYPAGEMFDRASVDRRIVAAAD